MIARLQKTFVVLGAAATFLLPLASPLAARAQVNCIDNPNAGGIQECVSSGSCQTDPNGCANTSPSDKVNSIIRTVINIFSLIVGVVAVIMIIIGGLKYITSSGESSNLSAAKNTILFAIVGLVIVVLAQVIVRFVLTKVTSTGQ